MNMSQDIKMQMVDDNVGNQVRHNAVQNDGNEVEQNAVQNLGIQIVENKNGISVVSEIANQYGNRNVVTAPAEGNGNGISGNPIRLLKRKKQGSKALKRNLTSTSRTQSDNAPIYDSDGSTKYVNGMKSRKKNQSANVLESANQKKHKANVKKSKKSEPKESLASPSKPRSFLRWLPTGRIFDLCRKTTSSGNTKSEFDISMCDNESASNHQEPTNKGFPSFTYFLDRFTRLPRQNTYTVMSDSDESGVTHTEISSPFEDLSDIWISDEDEVFPAEEQPLPAAASPNAQSPDYVPESDPEADPEEDDDEDPEEDPVDYPADGGDDGDDEDEPSDDDEDEEVDIEADDKEEEEHPTPADSTAVALPAADQAPSAEETKPISIPAPVPTPVWSDAEVARLLAISTPPSSPLSPWSSPLPQIPSPPLPPIPSPPLPVSSPVSVLSPSPPASPIRPLGYRAAMIRLRAKAASNSHSLPLPPTIILSYTRPAAPSSGTPPLHLSY
ncbi:hypothetical protein Tco_0327263 [Tanacetum coccineum]